MNRVAIPLAVAMVWAGWCFLHSFLISDPVVGWWRRRLGRRFAWYRLGYVLFSLLTLVPAVFFQFSVPQHLLFSWRGGFQILRILMLALAGALFWAGARAYDMKWFLGVAQVSRSSSGEVEDKPGLAMDGVLRWVRHPWYSGGILFLWAVDDITTVGLAAKVVLSAYLVVGASLEERKLLRLHGESYEAYRQQTPMFIPRPPGWSSGRRER